MGMEMTQDNVRTVAGFLREYASLDTFERANPMKRQIVSLAMKTYFSAFQRIEDARRVHGIIMRNELGFPRPAIIRKYMRLAGIPEVDIDTDLGL
jgi:hypothetical protein